MEEPPAMEQYQTAENESRKVRFYDNSKDSALLLEARSVCLRKGLYKRKYSGEDNLSIAC